MTIDEKMNDVNGENSNFALDIEIASDYYSAYLIIEIFNRNASITKKDIENFLEEKNIVNGIDYNVIDELANNPEQGKYLIATGKKHINGKDAKIEYKFDTDLSLHPEVNEDGSVNFKKINLLKQVRKDQLLAIKRPSTDGEKGFTVTGKEIFAKRGKDKNFKIGKGIVVSEDGLSIRSEYDGAISFINEKVSIDEVLELNDGVGVNTGNIDFPGKVLVRGTVDTGYTVKASDDIIIDGIVEGATLISNGSIEITKGVQGNDQAKIKCPGAIKAGFINSSHVDVGGDINVDIIMHSEVFSNGLLVAQGKRGTVVGGNYSVKKGIEAKTIGSEMGTITNLKVGIDNDLLSKYKQANEDQKKYSDEFRELVKNEKTIKKKINSGNRNKFILVQYRNNLERMKEIKPIIDQAKKDVKEIRTKFADLKGASVKSNLFYPGVKINITNTFYNIKQEIKNVEIVKQGGEIKIIGR